MQFPRRDLPTSQSGLQTPKKIGGGGGGAPPSSRPSTPPPNTPGELVNGSAVLAAALQKKLTRKRKAPSIEAEVRTAQVSPASQPQAVPPICVPVIPPVAAVIAPVAVPVPPVVTEINAVLGGGGPPAIPGVESPGKRTSGSLVTHHHDDVVTRMKNVEMIELGHKRIRPWYFSPYPQVLGGARRQQSQDSGVSLALSFEGPLTTQLTYYTVFT